MLGSKPLLFLPLGLLAAILLLGSKALLFLGLAVLGGKALLFLGLAARLLGSSSMHNEASK